MAEIKYHALVNSLEKDISSLLSQYSLSLGDSRNIAKAVKKLSDFYIANPEAKTPWQEDFTQIAQIAYYYPLNTLRAYHVLCFQNLEAESIVDLGSGLGAFSKAFLHLKPKTKIYNIEISDIAINLHQQIVSEENVLWLNSLKELDFKPDILSLSYSLTENISLKPLYQMTKSIFLLEPSTKEDFQHLLNIRDEVLQEGATILAPCPHSGKCPMQDGKRDWCHFQFPYERPSFIEEIESFLPWQHTSLAYSYLWASMENTKSPSQGKTRVIGRTLKEKGKVRQAICRSEKREFLSALKKDKVKLDLESGELVEIQGAEERGNEVRITVEPVSVSRS